VVTPQKHHGTPRIKIVSVGGVGVAEGTPGNPRNTRNTTEHGGLFYRDLPENEVFKHRNGHFANFNKSRKTEIHLSQNHASLITHPSIHPSPSPGFIILVVFTHL
jgi:hypothetical protein